MGEVIFSKNLKILIVNDVTRSHYVRLDIDKSEEVRSNIFNLRLTDPDDFLFLFTVTITEKDFQQLKIEQQLTIDYQSFSSVLIELLNECQLEEKNEHPIKRIELNLQTLRCVLSIVEPRKIRNVTELILYLNAADDSQQKRYLAKSLKEHLADNSAKEKTFISKITRLQDELEMRTAQHTLLSKEHGELKIYQNRHVDELKTAYEKRLHEDKENNIFQIREQKNSHEVVLKNIDNDYKSRIQTLEKEIRELRRDNEEYLREKTRTETTLREQKIQLDTLASEQNRMLAENEKNQEYKEVFDRQNKSRSERLIQLKSEVAVKKAELNECRNNQSRSEHQIRVAMDQKRITEEKCHQLHSEIQRFSNDNKQLEADLSKANDIICTKMEEVKKNREKLKRNVEILKKQELLLNQKDQDIKALGLRVKDVDKEKQSVEDNVMHCEKENRVLKESVKSLNEKVQHSDKVITYLNKQLNQLSHGKRENIPLEKCISVTNGTILPLASSRISSPKDQSTPLKSNVMASKYLSNQTNTMLSNKNSNGEIFKRTPALGNNQIDNKYVPNSSTPPLSAYFSSANGYNLEK